MAINGSNQHREGETSIHAPTVPAQEALPALESLGERDRQAGNLSLTQDSEFLKYFVLVSPPLVAVQLCPEIS